MIFNEQLQQRTAYNRQALEEARKALDDMVAKPQRDPRKDGEGKGMPHSVRIDRRFPDRPLTFKDILSLGFESIDQRDVFYLLLAFTLVTAVGMATPYVTGWIYETVIPSGVSSTVLWVLGALVGISVGTVVFETARTILLLRMHYKVEASLQAALMARTYAMPATFFRRYTSGEISNRVMSMTPLCYFLLDGIVSNLLTLVYSLIYFYQVFYYAHSLLAVSILIMLVNALFLCWEYWIQYRQGHLYMPRQSRLQGLLFSLFSGIQKIKTTGSEVRAFSKWAKAYNESRPSAYKDYVARFSTPISSLISVAGMALIYYQAVAHQVPIPDYMAFFAAFGLVSSGFSTLSLIVPSMANVKSLLELLKPLMDEVPEVKEEAPKVDFLSGGIEVHNLSFRYDKESPYVLKDLNLKIHPGEYVAIVGHSGCGKSTLMRLLLGFEKPESGSIFYDTYNIDKVDKQSLRQHIGTCMQDGELFSGSIFSNLTITAPQASMEDAWEAARLAALDKDIEKMPMKMHTLLSDGGSGLSGGQRQRILIARALMNKPAILFFDEATSALDNLTQKEVSQHLDALRCTRICVAHRLSTIIHCDRIILIEEGRVAEEGKYQELIEKKGLFYQLVRKQM